MERYKNLGGDSAISEYEIKDSSITVKFYDGAIYLYDYFKPGKVSVDYMKTLAGAGRGLNSYISTSIKKNYSKKLRERD
jgi:hypothetical protein